VHSILGLHGDVVRSVFDLLADIVGGILGLHGNVVRDVPDPVSGSPRCPLSRLRALHTSSTRHPGDARPLPLGFGFLEISVLGH
jgi:hypothetical protein